jgi:hypothetical protein
MTTYQAKEMAQWLKKKTHVMFIQRTSVQFLSCRWLTNICNSRGFNALFWLLQGLQAHGK